MSQAADPRIILPSSGLSAKDLAVIVNVSDPLSIQIAEYYQHTRHIPSENIIRIAFKPDQPVMHPGEFAVLHRAVEAKVPGHVQAYLLTWDEPYRVGCMSISTAFAMGFDNKYCAKGCKPTARSSYAGSNSLRPFDDLSIRPTMLLAADNFNDAKALIDRGVAADASAMNQKVQGAAYLVETPDKTRSVRKVYFPIINTNLDDKLPIKNYKTKAIRNKQDVMFYFTGDTFVDDIDTNNYLPGAIADHLTSTGGKLTDSFQMSAMRWLEAGATGSYGTVVEPCNLLGKFPNPLIIMSKYLAGSTLIEAYWKSVQMPGQGVFIGEPLAKPYADYRLIKQNDSLELHSQVLTSGHYKVLAAEQLNGPYKLLHSGIEINRFRSSITLFPPFARVYKIERLQHFAEPLMQYLLE
jgi:uncharacterized protein (TIGR03790 family)